MRKVAFIFLTFLLFFHQAFSKTEGQNKLPVNGFSLEQNSNEEAVPESRFGLLIQYERYSVSAGFHKDLAKPKMPRNLS